MFEISFEWRGDTYQATVERSYAQGVSVFLVNIPGRKQLMLHQDGMAWSCFPYIGYPLTKIIGQAIKAKMKEQ
jgi:hypothetical protein